MKLQIGMQQLWISCKYFNRNASNQFTYTDSVLQVMIVYITQGCPEADVNYQSTTNSPTMQYIIYYKINDISIIIIITNIVVHYFICFHNIYCCINL
jgi:hypothetical protein